MEIKTCEEYVLAELDSLQKELDAANELNEAYRKALGAAAKYLKSDDHGNIFVSNAAVNPANGRCMLQASYDDAALLSALSRLANGDAPGLKQRLNCDEDKPKSEHKVAQLTEDQLAAFKSAYRLATAKDLRGFAGIEENRDKKDSE